MDTNVQTALQEIVKLVPEILNSFIIYDYRNSIGVKNIESLVEKIKEHSLDFFLVIIADFQSVNEKKEKEIQDLFAKLHKPYCHLVREEPLKQSIESVPDLIGTTLATLIHEKWSRRRKTFYLISKDKRFESYCAALNISQKEHVTPVSLNIDEFLELKFVGGDRIENNLHPTLEYNIDWFKRNNSILVGRWLSFLGKERTETDDEYKARKNKMWKFFKKAAGENFNVNITTDYVKPLGVRKNIEKHHSDTRFSVYVDKEGEDHIIPFLQKLPEQFHSTVWSYKSESATLGGINSSSDHTNITERIRLIVNKGQGASGNDISVYKNGKFQQTCKFNLSPVSPPPFSSTSTAISAAEAPSLSSQTQPLHDSASQDLSTVISSVANIQISTVPICKFYRQKKCIYGKNCRNLHLDPK